MNNTRMGIHPGTIAALCYFSGIINSLIVVIIAGAVLYLENDEDLRYNVLQAVIIVLLFGILLNLTSYVKLPFSLPYLLKHIIRTVEVVILIYSGLKSKSGKKVEIPLLSNLIEVNF